MRSSRSVSFIIAGILCGLSWAQARISGTWLIPIALTIPRATVRCCRELKEIAHLLSRSGGKFSFPNHVAMAAPWKVQLAGLNQESTGALTERK